MLTIRNITKVYPHPGGQVHALADVSLDVATGQFAIVRGPSGCGKSTLLLAAGALLAPSEGQVAIEGQDPYELSPDARAAFRAATIGFVFQQFHLVPYLSVRDNVLTAALAGAANGAAERADALIERFGLINRTGHVPGQLSVGERQRTALARAMLNGPKLICADEPTGNLDEDNARSVIDALTEFATAGGAVLLVTHDKALDVKGAKTIYLDQGCVV